MRPLVDRFGRVHRDLRLSLTDKCSLRCRYCMPAEGLPWTPTESLLTAPEIERVVRVCCPGRGIRSVRLTGGEPCARTSLKWWTALPSLPPSAGDLDDHERIRLEALAVNLKSAGLQRVNVSLDSLDRDTFASLTLRDRHDDVVRGIEAAKSAGLTPIKVNAVLIRGINDHEVPAMLRWAFGHRCASSVHRADAA